MSSIPDAPVARAATPAGPRVVSAFEKSARQPTLQAWRLAPRVGIGPAAGASLFILEHAPSRAALRRVLRSLPQVSGAQIRVQRARGLRDRRGAVHAGAFVRERRIAFDCTRAEFPRIFVHELFHFIWLRRGNAIRRSYEELLRAELLEGAVGELGWSAEWRKRALKPRDVETRSRGWREYCCESFCDSAAWVYSGIGRHKEFTLEARFLVPRRAWFAGMVDGAALSI